MQPSLLLNCNEFKSRITNAEATVVMKLNQGTIRHRAVIDGGALFGSFLGKQKGTIKTI